MSEGSGLPYRPCVGVMLLNAEGRAWIGRRAGHGGEPEGVGTWWQMPQGGMDPGENPEQAARRELEEETGVRSVRFIARTREWHLYDLPPELVGIAWDGRYRGQKQLWFAGRFEGEGDSEIDIGPRGGHEAEFDSWRWVSVAELPGLVVPFKRQVYESVIAEFAPILQPSRKP
jgi:putative (di)nucleoside polyphosphate hydrolase